MTTAAGTTAAGGRLRSRLRHPADGYGDRRGQGYPRTGGYGDGDGHGGKRRKKESWLSELFD
ncbi:hypothetical protein CMMCA002_08135 [Clavibacter michiganensis subsp. michiganensis]|nr:hypothetical protein [Clavibacter michiganensis]OUE16111.1 hypothetical protein CMMCA002_08135 [Clavibacter michiganensis subsp. michiganensis]